MSIPLTQEKLIHKAGTNPSQGVIKPMRKKYYKVLTESVGGDAPKDMIRFYQYGKGKIANSKSWPKYIAKIGHKWYPNESITEHFFTSIGKYVKNSVPKISIPHNKKCNHFQLIAYIKENNYIKKKHVDRWTNIQSLEQTLGILNNDFVKLFTPERRLIIEKILNLRFQTLKSIIQ